MRRIWSFTLVCACGGGGSGDVELPELVTGRIEISEYDGLEAGYVTAHFTDAELQPELANDGTCRVYQQPCLGQVGACQAPEGFSAGTLEIAGLWQPVSMAPGWNNQYWADSVPREVFDSDAEIEVSASGDQIEAFTLAAGGVEPLSSELAGDELPELGDGPASLAWTPAAGGARIRLHVNAADVCHAGAHWLVLECDADDTGSLVVSSEVLQAIPAGYYGCGATLARYRDDRFAVDGVEIDLVVSNADWFNVLQVR